MEKIGVLVLAIIASNCYVAYSAGPTQLQDFCVATNDVNSAAFLNGLTCKNPMAITPDDFFFQGLNIQRNPDRLGFNTTLVSTPNLPGLNTLGVSMLRVDFEPHGLYPLHFHPRGNEILTVLRGRLSVGFAASNTPNSKSQFFPKVLNEGDVFAFPQGHIHFVQNIDQAPAVAIAAISIDNPVTVHVANAVFGSNPSMPVDVLSRAFRTNNNVVKQLQAQF